MDEVTTVGQVMMPVQDIIKQDEDIRMARRRMESEAKRSLIVVDGDAPVGMLEWGRMLRQDDTSSQTLVSDYMTRDVPLLTQDMPLDAAGQQLGSVDLETFPVVDTDGHLVGEVPRSAILRRQESAGEAMATEPIPAGAPVDAIPSPFSHIVNGMTVNGSDGSKLGQVSDLLSGVSGQLEALIVEHGLFGRKHKKVPSDLITGADDEQVVLTIGSTEFKQLADIEQTEVT